MLQDSISGTWAFFVLPSSNSLQSSSAILQLKKVLISDPIS